MWFGKVNLDFRIRHRILNQQLKGNQENATGYSFAVVSSTLRTAIKNAKQKVDFKNCVCLVGSDLS